MTFPSGFLIIDKPTGVTSFAMVALVRRLTGVRRVGHAGTLDPLASGVLPVAIGQAARFIEYLDDVPKTYLARIRFGTTTDTYDSEGAATSNADASHINARAVSDLFPSFTGDIDQVPPAFSAIKRAGKPLYSYARAGEAVQLQPRSVHVERLDLTGFEAGTSPEAEVEVVCGKGTYIRSLAHDFGQRLGVGAHLAALRRTSTGGFDVRLARTPEALEELADQGCLESALLATDRAVERRRAAIVGSDHATDVRAGRDSSLFFLAATTLPLDDQICRAYDTEGRFIGVLRHEGGGLWHPVKVLPEA